MPKLALCMKKYLENVAQNHASLPPSRALCPSAYWYALPKHVLAHTRAPPLDPEVSRGNVSSHLWLQICGARHCSIPAPLPSVLVWVVQRAVKKKVGGAVTGGVESIPGNTRVLCSDREPFPHPRPVTLSISFTSPYSLFVLCCAPAVEGKMVQLKALKAGNLVHECRQMHSAFLPGSGTRSPSVEA